MGHTDKKSNFPFVVIEGISYSGKTTLSNLCKNHGFTVLSELSEFCTFPPLPEANEDVNTVDKWFFDQNVARLEEIKDSYSINKVILDRYFLSDLAYIFARQHTYGIGGINYYESLILEGLKEKKIIIPWYAYIYIDIELYLSRKLIDEANLLATSGINKRNRTPFGIKHKLFFENQISFYYSFFNKNNDNVICLDGSLDPEFSCQQLIKWVNQLPSNLPSQTLKL